MKAHILLLVSAIALLSSSCTQSYPIFEPLENIRLGMTEEEVYTQFELYDDQNMFIGEDKLMIIEGIKFDFYFHFCTSPFFKESTLEGIELELEEDNDIDRLYEILEKKLDPDSKASPQYKKHVMDRSVAAPDKLTICLYTDKLRYSAFGFLSCVTPKWIKIRDRVRKKLLGR